MNDTELNINLKALKKVDPYIVNIEAHSSQVALYKYNSGKGDWEKTEVEGTLFVYEREAEPQHGFTIMNRLSMDNLVEPVTKELDFQLQSPFLLYRNNVGDIYGIWFYEQAECEKVGGCIVGLVRGAERKKDKRAGQGGGKQGGDLQTLLRAAAGASKPSVAAGQNGHNQGQGQEEGQGQSLNAGQNLLRLLSQPEPAETGPIATQEKTSASVKDFFALASAGGSSSSPPLPATSSAFTVPALPAQPPLPIRALPISQGLAMGAIPVGGYSMLGGHTPGSPGHLSAPPPGPGQVHTVESLEAEQRRSTSPPAPGPATSTARAHHLESQLKQKLYIGQTNFSPVRTAGPPPTLLSPQAFSSGRPTESPSPARLESNGHGPGPVAGVTPLTAQQLQEALTFLLETDQEFVQRLHQGYVAAINRRFQALKQ